MRLMSPIRARLINSEPLIAVPDYEPLTANSLLHHHTAIDG